MIMTKKSRLTPLFGGVSLVELTLFHFVTYGIIVFIAAWLAFHLLASHSARFTQLQNEKNLVQLTAQFDSLLRLQTTVVESLARDAALARLLVAENSQRDIARLIVNKSVAGLLLSESTQRLEVRQVELEKLFPFASRVKLLRSGEESALIEKTGANQDPLPLVANTAKDDVQHVGIVRAVHGAGEVVVGYLWVTFDNELLQQMLDKIAGSHGYLEVRQAVEKGQDKVLAARGDAALKKPRSPLSAPVPGTEWTLIFWPAMDGSELMTAGGGIFDLNNNGAAAVAPVARLFWSIFASALLLMALLAFLFGKMITRLVRGDLNVLMTVVREGGKNAERHHVMLHNFQGAMDAAENAVVNPVSSIPREQSLVVKASGTNVAQWDLDDVMQIFQKEESSAVSDNDQAKQRKDKTMVPASIFRAYDIRGVVGTTLTPDIVYELGRAIGSEAYARGQQTVIVARDGRLSGPEFVQALSNGLRASGRDVIDVGRVPTPVLYFATHYLSSSSGVMVTGSHNPPDYNGFKMVLRGETLAEMAIQRLRSRIETGDLMSGKGSYRAASVVPDYIERITSDIRLARPLKVVVDCGNGVAGEIAPHLIRLLGCDVTELYCDIDGTFPNHHPDPSQPENLADLVKTVKKLKADVGLAFDGDGDRLGVVSSQGEIIWADRQMMMYAKDVLSRNPGAEIIFDIKCSTHLARVIREHGGQPLMWKTGHSLVKAKMKETGAPLAGEMSGHIFFKERWYGFDDALYTAARLLEILARDARSSSEIFAELPNSISTPELKIELQEGEQLPFIARLLERAQFPDAEMTTIDGLRVDFRDGWGLVRASNTTPSLVLRFEADTPAVMRRIQEQFRSLLLELDPKLKLPF